MRIFQGNNTFPFRADIMTFRETRNVRSKACQTLIYIYQHCLLPPSSGPLKTDEVHFSGTLTFMCQSRQNFHEGPCEKYRSPTVPLLLLQHMHRSCELKIRKRYSDQATDWKIRVSNSGCDKFSRLQKFYLLQSPESTQFSIQLVPQFFHGSKSRGVGGGAWSRTLPSSAEVKNELWWISSTSVCLHGVDRDVFILHAIKILKPN